MSPSLSDAHITPLSTTFHPRHPLVAHPLIDLQVTGYTAQQTLRKLADHSGVSSVIDGSKRD